MFFSITDWLVILAGLGLAFLCFSLVCVIGWIVVVFPFQKLLEWFDQGAERRRIAFEKLVDPEYDEKLDGSRPTFAIIDEPFEDNQSEAEWFKQFEEREGLLYFVDPSRRKD